MLVFAVLMDSTGLTSRKQGIVVVHKKEHQLPLFVITFEPKHHGFQMPPRLAQAVAQARGYLPAGLTAMNQAMNRGAMPGLFRPPVLGAGSAALGLGGQRAQAQAQPANRKRKQKSSPILIS